MKAVKTFILCLIFLSSISSFFALKNFRKHDHDVQFRTFASSSTFYSLKDGENGTSRQFNHEEKYEDKDGDKPVEKREYSESLDQKGDGPAIIKKKGVTNVEKEKVMLPDLSMEKVDDFDLKNFLDDFHHRGKGLKYGQYEDYLNQVERNLLDSKKMNNKHNSRDKHNTEKLNLHSDK